MAVTGLSGVTAVAAGLNFSSALLGNGTVMTGVKNLDGQLGDGTTHESDVPVKVTGLSGVTAIAAGGLHAMALLGNGTVMDGVRTTTASSATTAPSASRPSR